MSDSAPGDRTAKANIRRYWPRIEPVLERLFGEITPDAQTEFSSLLEWVQLAGGERLFRQGDLGDSMFILVSGRLKVVLENQNPPRPVSEVAAGEIVGEMALITKSQRSASIYAMRDCSLVRLSSESFERLVTQRPVVGINLSRLVVERLTPNADATRTHRRVKNVSIVPLHPSVDVTQFSQSLYEQLKLYGSAVLLSSGWVDNVLGTPLAQTPLTDSTAHNRLSAWLEEIEQEHDIVVYVADQADRGRPTEWTRRCLRQCDEIVLVADAVQSPELTPLEQECLEGADSMTSVRRCLVLVHPESLAKPSGSSTWLTPRDPVTVFHLLHSSRPESIERLVRYLTNKSVGLVLSGGGARGYAHVGVWRALQEQRIPVDWVGGTSFGAWVGALIALGWSWQDILDSCRRVAHSRAPREVSLIPLVSLLRGKHIDRQIRQDLKDDKIEDCPIGYYCVSSNLTLASPMIHRRGSMFKAVRASVSLPGIMPPVPHDRCLHVDGGLFDNFPIKVMAQMGVETIVGVDVHCDTIGSVDCETMPSGWAILRRRLFPRAKDANSTNHNVPSIFSTLIESTMLNSYARRKEDLELLDIHIHPDISSFSSFDWKAVDSIAEVGYQASLKSLAEREDVIRSIPYRKRQA